MLTKTRLALILALAFAGCALAAEPLPPPPLPSEAATANVIANPQAVQRARSARKSISAVDEGFAPTKKDMEKARAHRKDPKRVAPGSLGADVEEVRQGNRIHEIVVTPGLTRHSYTMTNTDNPEVGGPGKTGGKLTNTKQLRFGF